jgi:hypothetical protein
MTNEYSFFFSINNVLPNLYNYLFNPFRRIPTFPFVKPKWGVYAVPFLKAYASPAYQTEQIRRSLYEEYYWVYLFFVLIVLMQLVPLLPLGYISMRYSGDFAYSAFILAGLGFGYSIWSGTDSKLRRVLIFFIGSGLAFIGSVTSILLAFTGYFGLFEKVNPQLFNKISKFLSP